MAIRELSQTAMTVAELKNKVVGAALANRIEYANSANGNLTLQNITPEAALPILSKELEVEFEQVNGVAWQAKVHGLMVTIATQGRSTLVMFKSYGA